MIKYRGQLNHFSSIQNVEDEDIPDALAEYFSSVYNAQAYTAPTTAKSQNNTQLDITLNGVQALLQRLDVRKAHGPECISTYTTRAFAENVPSFTKCVHQIVYHSVKDAQVPRDWKHANIIPVFKARDRNTPSNYRPISLTSVFSKTLEHIVVSQMWDHINESNLLTARQHGFRKSYNTTTQLIHVTHNLMLALNKGYKQNVVSFDFSKAFDKVPHLLLIHKLKQYNFPAQIINWIKEWL